MLWVSWKTYFLEYLENYLGDNELIIYLIIGLPFFVVLGYVGP